MGFKALSTVRSGATSAVSRQATVINTGQGFAVGGSTIKSNTTISADIITPGQGSNVSLTTGGISITSVSYLNADGSVSTANAVSTSGGNIKINGTGFSSPMTVIVGTTTISNANVTVANSSAIIASLGSSSPGNVSVYAFNSSNVGAVKTNGISYSGAPVWTTTAASFQNGAVANVALVASSDSALTYTLQAGSTLPTGITLNSTGYLVGTATGYINNTSSTAVIVATDAEGQATQQTLNITVTTADSQFPYTTLLLNGETSVTPFITDSSTNNFGLTINGDTRADKFSPYYGNGYYGVRHSATPDYLSVPHNANFSINTGSTDIFIIEGWFYFNAVTAQTSLFDKSGVNGTSFANWMVYLNASRQITLTWGVSGTPGTSSVGTVASTTVPVVGTWYHIVFVKSNADWAVFANGTRIITYNGLNTANDGNPSALKIGYGIQSAANSAYFNGIISNVRAWRGTSGAPYSATSTTLTVPTSPLTAIAGTTLLTHQSARFVDVSSAAATVTATGANIKVLPAIPFAASSSYATYGSAYFDGTGDYLSIPSSSALTLGTNNHTIECWAYLAGTQQTYTTLWAYSALATNQAANSYYLSVGSGSGNLLLGNGAAGWGINIAISITNPLNGWHHFAVVRNGNVFTVYIDGVSAGTGTYAANISAQTSAMYVGTQVNGSSTNLIGYIADFRFVNGTALYTTNFTPPTAPLTAVANTQLLTCQYNGGANNYGIIDNGPNNFVITRNGNTTQGSFSPFSPTGWSNYFDGTGDYITIADNAALQALTSDFSVEAFVYSTASTLAHRAFISKYDGTINSEFVLRVNSSGNLDCYVYHSGSSYLALTGPTFPLNQWNHVALCRTGNVFSLFLNGTRVATLTGSVSINDTGLAFSIGGAGASYPWQGYISNVRYVVGSSVYNATQTSLTVPVAPLTAVANTQILTCCAALIRDMSINAYAVTRAGDASIQPFSPFSPAESYSSATHGGSAFFDGTGDNLTLAGNAAFSLNTAGTPWLVECWFYPTSKKSATIISQAASAWRVNIAATGVMDWVFGTTSVSTTVDQYQVSAWNHFAVCYDGSSYRLYLNGKYQFTGGALPPTDSTSTIYIGRNTDSAAWDFAGYIGDIRVVKGASAAVYTGTTTITVPTAPLTSIPGTSLLCNFTNAGIVDAHSTAVLSTVGNVAVSSAQKKYGNSSIYFDGTGDYLTTSQLASPNYDLVATDFTIEGWFYNAGAGAERYIFSQRGASSGWELRINATNAIQFFYTGGSTLTTTGTISANTWTHLAVTRSGTTVRIFINGVQDSSATFSNGTSAAASYPLYIGYSTSGGGYFLGYMDDIRITRGLARYTANFTPPASAMLGQ